MFEPSLLMKIECHRECGILFPCLPCPSRHKVFAGYLLAEELFLEHCCCFHLHQFVCQCFREQGYLFVWYLGHGHQASFLCNLTENYFQINYAYNILKKLKLLLSVCALVHVCVSVSLLLARCACGGQRTDNLWGVFLSFHHVSEDWTWAIRLSGFHRCKVSCQPIFCRLSQTLPGGWSCGGLIAVVMWLDLALTSLIMAAPLSV